MRCARPFRTTSGRRTAAPFFRSIHGTLNHLLLTDRAWLGRFTGDRALAHSRDEDGNVIASTGKLNQELYADFALLRRERAATDAAIEAWARDLTAERLAASFAYRSSDGRQHEHPLWLRRCLDFCLTQRIGLE